MFNKKKIKELETKLSKLRDTIFDLDNRISKLQRPFKFEIAEEVAYICPQDEKLKKGIIFSRWQENTNNIYHLSEDGEEYEDYYYEDGIPEKNLIKIENIKEAICGRKTVRGTKNKTTKKRK